MIFIYMEFQGLDNELEPNELPYNMTDRIY